MSLITIGTDLVDVCDIAIVASSGSTSVVYFQDGTYISSALTAAAQANAVNGTAAGALLTTVVTSSNFGTCYIAGQQVKRVRAAGANSTWELWSGLGPVLVSGVDSTAAGVLIDATVACGGGGGGGGRSIVYAPSISGMLNTSDAAFENGYPTATFTPDDGGVGGVVQIGFYVQLNADGAGLTQFAFPIPVGLIPSDGVGVCPGIGFFADVVPVPCSFILSPTVCSVTFTAPGLGSLVVYGLVTYRTDATPA